MKPIAVEPSASLSHPAEPPEAVFARRLAKTEEAVELFHQHLLRYVHGLTKQWQDAEDILSALWKYVLLHFPEEKMLQLGLLRRKAYQLFVDHYRSARRRRESFPGELPEVPVEGGSEAEFSAGNEAELQRRFFEAFPVELTDDQKSAVFLHGRGYSYLEIGQMMRTPSSTIGDWVALGRRRLRELINQQS